VKILTEKMVVNYVQVVESLVDGNGGHEITVFVLACFIGYYVVWKVTPALHAPLMSITNAISSVIIIGAIFVLTRQGGEYSKILGWVAIALASINIFGGFVVTRRMLNMFNKK
jgi:NAD(P) transhydrogenase subunit alpha